MFFCFSIKVIAEEQVDFGSCIFFFFPSNPLAPELPLSPPLTDGANEPLYAAASHCDTGTEVLLLVLSHSQNTSATASEVDNVCITTRA